MNLQTKIAGIDFKNPVWTASGTFGQGKEFQDFLELTEVGAVIGKTVTLEARQGNKPPRIVETASGLLNSIGLENNGIDCFQKEYWPFLKRLDTKVVISIAGSTEEEFVKCAEKLSQDKMPDALELNLSCPNVEHKDTKYKLISQDPKNTEKIINAVKKKAACPVFAKLTPNVTDIAVIAQAAESGGADAVVMVNTYMGMAVDAGEQKPILGNIVGGLSGPAIKPMALKAVRDVYNSVNIPVIGMGGIMTGIDVAEFMLCGAAAVQVGTANLADPGAYKRILEEFKDYLEKQGIKNPKELVGKLKVNG